MSRFLRVTTFVKVLAFVVFFLVTQGAARAESAAGLNRDAKMALQKLFAESMSAKALAQQAKAILVFPNIRKGGFIVGGQYGEGVLLKNGKPLAYYNTLALSYGLQAGLQKFGYALFFMTDEARNYLDRSDGWELGTGPSIVIVDEGVARSLSTTTLQSGVYAFFFNQRGLMAGLGLQGTKITKIDK